MALLKAPIGSLQFLAFAIREIQPTQKHFIRFIVLGRSIFAPMEPFSEFERVEKPYKDLFVVLELYPKKTGHFYVLPYVQSGDTSGNYTRRVFGFAGEYETREAAEQAGFDAGKKRNR